MAAAVSRDERYCSASAEKPAGRYQAGRTFWRKLPQTAKSCGPGLPTLRSSSQESSRATCERRGQESPVPEESAYKP